MTLRESITNNPLINAGKRLFAPSKANEGGNGSGGVGVAFGGMQFNSIADFINYYKSEAFKVAYSQMDAFTCYNLAFSNSWISSVINAIARPISTAELIGIPKDPENPDDFEIQYINELFADPNPNDTAEEFRYDLAVDLLATGNAYIEVAYNQFGFPVSLYRHYPYMITKKNGVYYHRNGYQFKEGEIIHIKLFNPFSENVGMSPFVPVVAAIMLDSSIMANNMKYFENNQLKGILSVDNKLNYQEGRKEVEAIQEQIKEMRQKGQEGHLAAFGVSFQTISSTNKEMMTPELEQSVRKRILAIYGVPPSKVSLSETGSIGGNVEETQADTMNDTLEFWARMCFIGPIQKHFMPMAAVENTKVDFTGLTKKDEIKEATLQKQWIDSYTKTINEIRGLRGEEPFDDPAADEPLVPGNLVPLSSLSGMQQGNSDINPSGTGNNNPDDGNEPDDDGTEPDDSTNQYIKALKKQGLII